MTGPSSHDRIVCGELTLWRSRLPRWNLHLKVSDQRVHRNATVGYYKVRFWADMTGQLFNDSIIFDEKIDGDFALPLSSTTEHDYGRIGQNRRRTTGSYVTNRHCGVAVSKDGTFI